MSNNFGPVSLSELSFYVNRAAFGAGCSYGVADDITTLAVSLAKKNDDPTSILTEALDNIADGHVDTKLSKSQHNDELVFSAASCGQVSAISAGIAASDAVKMIDTSAPIFVRLTNVDLPALSVLCLNALSENISIEKIEISTQQGSQNYAELSSKDSITSGDLTLTIVKKDLSSSTKTPAINDHYNILVSQAGWDGIRKHFNNSLVLATEESRLSGAGAGVVDTD